MGKNWSAAAVRYLEDWRICPRCDAQLVGEGCPVCGAELSGPVGGQLVDASRRVVKALRARDRLIDRVPTHWRVAAGQTTPETAEDPRAVPAGSPVSRPVPVATVPPAWAAAGSAERRDTVDPSAQVSVQSVLAFAGAALLAVAALVFTFFNPDLTSFAVRTTITAVITVVFLGGAWLFAHRTLRFSAESVGALGVVFVALDVWAFVQLAPPGSNPAVFAAIGTLTGSLALFLLGARTGVRVWLWAAVVGLALSPGLLGSGGSGWSAVLGSLGVAVVALGLHPVLTRLSPRLGSALGVERHTATTLQLLAVATALVQLMVLAGSPGDSPGIVGNAGILAVLAVVTALASRNGLPRLWSFAAGALAVAAVSVLPLALRIGDLAWYDTAWYLVLVPLAGGITLVGLTALRSTPVVSRPAQLDGAIAVLVLGAAPALLSATLQLADILFAPLRWAGSVAGGASSAGDFAYVAGSGSVAGYGSVIPVNVGLASILGVAALAGAAAGVALVSRADAAAPAASPTAPAAARPARSAALALWLGMFALVTLAGWAGWAPAGQAVVALVLAGLLGAALVYLPVLVSAPSGLRRPVRVGAHLLLVLAAVVGWSHESTIVWVGAAAVLVLAGLARSAATRWRPLYLGLGYAYALLIVATALRLAGVDGIAVLCLTATLGLLCGLAATLTTWLTPRGWYAVLSVSAVPFLTAIVAVLLVRSGWTALSTAVAFALALTLTTTRRAGLTLPLRAFSAGLLVPSLAVVVVCLGAQLLPTSGSPVVLPLIAVIVAATFAASGLIGQALARLGLSTVETDACRRLIEASAGVTAVLTVLLALLRTAAGLPTTVLVLVILGVGAAVTAFTTGRGQAWWAAGASWTGALWCVWALQGITVLEPYVLPPALALLVVGVVLVLRRKPAETLLTTGLALGVVPSLAVLAVAGTGTGTGGALALGAASWRTYGLLGAALLIVVIGSLIARSAESARVAPLKAVLRSTAVITTLAASAGAVQAVRWGLGLDPVAVSGQTGIMLPVLLLSALAAVLATAGARLAAPSRWRYAAATVFLVAGPITAIRPDWFSISTLVLLMVAVLDFMLVVAARARTRPVTLPPVWFLFVLAWCTAVAGWSERELRVEAFSIPLGLALLGAGIIALRPGAVAVPARLTSWPAGFSGSWALLAPGLVVTFLPSVLATGTDPQTWRAILVMAFALTAILIGSTRRLAAPFLLSLAVLPIEVIVVFTVQIGQTINPLLWWITLATIGAVLLVIAITSERKGATSGGLSARLRDLT